MVDRVAVRRGVPAGLSGPAGPAAGHLQPLLRQHPAPGSGGQGAPRHPVLDGRHRRRAQPAPECGADPTLGILGAAIASSVAYSVLTLSMLVLYHRLSGVPFGRTLLILPSDFGLLASHLLPRRSACEPGL